MRNLSSPWTGNIRSGGGFLVLAALFAFHGAAAHDGGAWSLSPALFPLLLSAGLAFLALALIGQGILRLREGREHPSSVSTGAAPVSARRAALTFGLCIAYVLLLPLSGFFVGTALFLALFSVLIGERRPAAVAALSLLSPAGILLIFRYALGVLLP